MTGDSSQAKLLVVDDDPLLRGMAARTLRHAGFEVAEAASGEQALEIFAADPCALVLLDVMMPGIDGFEVCSRLRAMPQGAGVPVLMLTGLNDTGSIEGAYQAGATDFIPKPINWTLLAQRVRYALRAAAAVTSAHRSRDRLERAQRIAHLGGWEVLAQSGALSCSAELARIYGADGATMGCATFDGMLERVHPDDRETVQRARQVALDDGRPYQLTFRIQRFDGALRTVFEHATALFDAAGRRIGVEGITQDITDRVEAQRRITHLAHFDLLTGLPNRQFFAELAAPAIERSARLRSNCALLHLDIDRFKSVNDALGHAEGDAVLRILAERLQASVRATDIAVGMRPGHDALVGRVGANAFTVLLVDVGGERQAAMVAERLMRAVSLPVYVREHELVLTASVGIAMFPRDATDVVTLERCGEQAAYAAKSSGRALHRFFDEAMNQRASAQLAQENELRRAIAEGQLCLHYQPKVDARSGRIVGAEALVRWQHPERGLIQPGAFVPLAEDCGLIGALTDWVLASVCADLQARKSSGRGGVPVSVNLAATSFADDALPGRLDALLEQHGLQPADLVLEVTESLLMTDVEDSVRRLAQYKARGFSLSLDDFGTGYSSLSYLKVFPVDELKIDRSFVTDAGQGGRDSAIAASIIALGREFGMHVVAEGVETAEQSRFLVEHGCACQQGWLFSPAVPADVFDALLERGAVAPGPAVQTP